MFYRKNNPACTQCLWFHISLCSCWASIKISPLTLSCLMSLYWESRFNKVIMEGATGKRTSSAPISCRDAHLQESRTAVRIKMMYIVWVNDQANVLLQANLDSRKGNGQIEPSVKETMSWPDISKPSFIKLICTCLWHESCSVVFQKG